MSHHPTEPRTRPHPVVIIVGALFIALKVAYAVRAMLPNDTGGIHAIVGSDTPTYTTASQTSIFSQEFYKAPGPFIFPLMLKLLRRNFRRVIVAQTLISIASWLATALSIRQAMRTSTARWLAYIGVLATGLTPAFIMYDVAIATESLAISSTCVVIALGIRLATKGDHRYVVAFVFALIVAAFVRDINAIIAGSLGLVALAALAVPSWRHAHGVRLTASAAVLIVVGGAAMTLSAAANRSYWPIAETITLRIADDPQAYRWLVNEGMPDDGAVQRLQDNYFLQYPAFQSDDAYYRPLRQWLDDHGQATYTKFLMTHPMFVISKPFEMLADQFTPNLEPIATAQHIRPDPIARTIGRLGLPSFRITAAWAAIATTGLGIALWVGNRTRRRIGFTILGIGFIVIPHALAAFHGDALELARHSLGAAVQARLFVWAATAYAIDEYITRRRQRQVDSITTVSV